MAKTSLTDYAIAAIMGSAVIGVFIFFYVLAAPNYDLNGVDSSELNAYGNFTKISEDMNSSVNQIYETNADAGLFDVLGGLVVKALSAIKSLIAGIKFMTINISAMLGSNLFYIPPIIQGAIVLTIITLIGLVLLFRYISGKEDEK